MAAPALRRADELIERLTLATRTVTPEERHRVVDAAMSADTWAELPAHVRSLVEQIEQRPGWVAAPETAGQRARRPT